jgi:ATP-dependent protease HslVU (ClpYQ) peptidase subunit
VTVIAYRKGILAGDSCWSEEDGLVVNIQNKLVRLRSGAIYGGAGACDDRALLRMLQNVRTPEQLPMPRDLAADDLSELECLLVLPDRSVWIIEGGPEGGGVCPVKLPFIAIGSGKQVAMGALAANKTAEEAVRIACDWHRTCCRPVHTLDLRGDRSAKRTDRTPAVDRAADDGGAGADRAGAPASRGETGEGAVRAGEAGEAAAAAASPAGEA